MTNPATLSTLSRLFAPGVVVAELSQPGDPDLLFPQEAVHVANAVPKRVGEFAAGRLCARRALAQFGIVDFPLTAAKDRQPNWPDSVVGSITHTAGFYAAAVAARTGFAALGLDSEVVGDVNVEIWPSICLPSEISWIRSLAEDAQAAAATLIFSAKEAFYKCQYPLTGEFLSFDAVSVEPPQWGAQEGAFLIRPMRSIHLSAHARLPLQGHYRFHGNFLTAGVALAAASGSAQ
jgi:4'-phosphopantetheinyl transferase EntD